MKSYCVCLSGEETRAGVGTPCTCVLTGALRGRQKVLGLYSAHSRERAVLERRAESRAQQPSSREPRPGLSGGSPSSGPGLGASSHRPHQPGAAARRPLGTTGHHQPRRKSICYETCVQSAASITPHAPASGAARSGRAGAPRYPRR